MKFEYHDQSYSLTEGQINKFRKNGYLKIKNVLSKKVVEYYNHIITKKVTEMNVENRPLDQRDTYGKAFLQLFNLWREDDEIKKLVFSKRLARIAATLMCVEGIRIYHDQALYKEPGGGITPWHADHYYWPLKTNKSITAWIPLQNTPLEMGPLEFSAGSQSLKEGRDLKISDESESFIESKLLLRNFKHIIEPYDIGEISFHSGRIFHHAGVNRTNQTRKVMTIIYMDKNMILKEPENANQRLDWETWCPGAEVNKIIDTPLNPVII